MQTPSILLSIQPKWCEKIFSGEKTVEIRKNSPKLAPPFKCYVYCTLQKTIGDFILCKSEENSRLFGHNTAVGVNKHVARYGDVNLKGKVIGEFVCNGIFPIRVFENGSIQDYNWHSMWRTCVSYDEIARYIGNNNIGCGWEISDVILYDTPKELSCFTNINGEAIKKAPQSWGYVVDV